MMVEKVWLTERLIYKWDVVLHDPSDPQLISTQLFWEDKVPRNGEDLNHDKGVDLHDDIVGGGDA